MQQGIETVYAGSSNGSGGLNNPFLEKVINKKISELNAEGKIVINVSVTYDSAGCGNLLATILWQKS